jgi:hypothetical protein
LILYVFNLKLRPEVGVSHSSFYIAGKNNVIKWSK